MPGLAYLIELFNRNLNSSCLVYMFSLHFSASKFLIKSRRQCPLKMMKNVFLFHLKSSFRFQDI